MDLELSKLLLCQKLLSIACAAIIGAITILGTSSCKDENKCATVACAVGVCKDGTCECPTGYSGPNCGTIWATKYIYIWDMNDGVPYEITFKPSTDMSVILMDNFYEGYNNVICELTSEKTFKFRENQVFSGLTVISGQGEIDALGIKITGKYKVKDYTGETVEFDFVATKG